MPPSTDEHIFGAIARVHGMRPCELLADDPNTMSHLRQAYWMLDSNVRAFEGWLRSMTATIEGRLRVV